MKQTGGHLEVTLGWDKLAVHKSRPQLLSKWSYLSLNIDCPIHTMAEISSVPGSRWQSHLFFVFHRRLGSLIQHRRQDDQLWTEACLLLPFSLTLRTSDGWVWVPVCKKEKRPYVSTKPSTELHPQIFPTAGSIYLRAFSFLVLLSLQSLSNIPRRNGIFI